MVNEVEEVDEEGEGEEDRALTAVEGEEVGGEVGAEDGVEEEDLTRCVVLSLRSPTSRKADLSFALRSPLLLLSARATTGQETMDSRLSTLRRAGSATHGRTWSRRRRGAEGDWRVHDVSLNAVRRFRCSSIDSQDICCTILQQSTASATRLLSVRQEFVRRKGNRKIYGKQQAQALQVHPSYPLFSTYG